MRKRRAGTFLVGGAVALLVLVTPRLNAAEIPTARQTHESHGLQVQKSATDAQWEKQESGTKAALWSVKAIDELHAWASGDSGIVLRTVDGGLTWKILRHPDIFGKESVYSLDALDSSRAWVTTSPPGSGWTYLFRTTNGGVTWDTVDRQQGSFLDAIRMFTPQRGLALGDPANGKWVILRTNDGGVTWMRESSAPVQAGSETGLVNSFAAVGEQLLFFGTSAGSVYRSTDGGLTWTYAQTGQSPVSSIAFSDSLDGVATGYDIPSLAPGGPVSYTTDGGLSWQSYLSGSPGELPIEPLASVGTGDVWAGSGEVIDHSTNSGRTWHSEFSTMAIAEFMAISMVREGNGAVGWIVNAGGEVWKGMASTLTGAAPSAGSLPPAVRLEQNYPNPFNPSTTIRYALPRRSHVTLAVFNTLGQRVATLMNGEVEAGYHEIAFNAAGLASGVYFYRLQAGDFVQVRKLVVLK